jgi:hypothetical protein
MCLNNINMLKFSQIKNEFGGLMPIFLNRYYSNSSTGYTSGVAGIPASGTPLKVGTFRNKTKTRVLAEYPPSNIGSTGWIQGTAVTPKAGVNNSGSYFVWSKTISGVGTYSAWTNSFWDGNHHAHQTIDRVPSTIWCVNINDSIYANTNNASFAELNYVIPTSITVTSYVMGKRLDSSEAWSFNQAPRKWTLEQSADGTSWTLIHSFEQTGSTSLSAWQTANTRTFTPTASSYGNRFRLRLYQASNDIYVSMGEFYLIGYV